MPQKLCYPMRYQEVANCFEKLNEGDIYLYFWFHFSQDLLTRNSYTAAKGEYTMLSSRFDPERDASFLHGYDPAINLTGTRLVEVQVSALPRNEAQEIGLHGRDLPSFLRFALHQLGDDVWKNKWRFSLTLCTKSQTFESVLQRWNGLQELPPLKTVVPLLEETNDAPSSN